MARVQHNCTGCVPIDASIIDVYIQLIGLKDRTEEAAERAEYAAEHAIGKSPYIGENGDWWEWDDEQGAFIDTGVQAQGSIAVDIAMSSTSTNPVQNKVITAALNGKYTKPASGIPSTDIAPGVIPDVSQFITASVNNLVNYYLKSETYNKTEVDSLIAAVSQFSYEVVASLPTASASTMYKIYLVPSQEPKTQNVKDEYITIRSGSAGAYTYAWEQIGSTAIDLSGYVTTEQLNTALGAYTTTANLTTLLAAKQDVIADLATIRSGASAGATAYQKPGTGIPKTDLASGVQASLDLADSAIQARPMGEVDPTITPAEYATKEELDTLEHKVSEIIPIDVDKKFVNYSTGAISSAVSGFYIKEVPVIAGDVLVINTSMAHTSAAVVAMYKGGTYSQADSIQAASIGNDLHNVTLTIPADVTKVVVGYQGTTPTSAYIKYYCKKWVDYISGKIKDSSYTKVFPETESGYYSATVGSAISTASSSTFLRTSLIDIEGLKTIRVSFQNGVLNKDASKTGTVPYVILTDKDNIVLYANNTFVNNSEIDLSLYPTAKYLALVIFASSMREVAYEYNEVEKLGILSSDYATDISTLKESTSQLEGDVSAINSRTFNSPFSVSKKYVLYSTGELAAGTDGFKYEEISVCEGDFVRVYTKITPTTAAIIAAYNGDTYVQSASIKTNSVERTIDYVVPAGVNKLRVSAQYDLGTEQYYVKTCRYALYSETIYTKNDEGYYGNFPKFQDFVVGRQSILYLNNIGRKYEDTINEFYTLQSGYPPSGYIGSPLAISYTPNATGSTDITFVKKRNISDTLASRKITFRSVSKNTGNGETKNIIFIGDSLIASGDASEQVYNMLVEDADYTINMLGDHETGGKVNAGHGSWSWGDWINPAGESSPIYGVTNPFMHNGELDFANFMLVNYPSLSGIDIAVISLGTNDMAQGAGGINKAQEAVANAKVFIDALLADYPNCKIALGIPSCGAYSAGATGFAHYPQGFRNSILLYAKEMIDTFDNGAYHANVTCVFHGWFIDLDNDYPNQELTLPSGVKTKCVTNFIHPSAVGYRHWGVGYYNKIRAILSGVL